MQTVILIAQPVVLVLIYLALMLPPWYDVWPFSLLRRRENRAGDPNLYDADRFSALRNTETVEERLSKEGWRQPDVPIPGKYPRH